MSTPVQAPPSPQQAPVAGQRKPSFLKLFLRDLATLKRPVTTANLVALVVEAVSPFGLNVGAWGPRITAGLVTVGIVTAYIESRA